MSILGAGACPAGSTGAGIGAFSVVNSSAARLFLKSDGTRGNVAYINPTTLDYEVDERGVEVGADATPMKVQSAMNTLRDRSAVPNFGLDLLRIETISANVSQQVEALVRECLSFLTTPGLISIMSIDVERFEETGLAVHTKWVDLATGQIHLEHTFP